MTGSLHSNLVILDRHERASGEIIADHKKRAVEQAVDDLDLGGGEPEQYDGWAHGIESAAMAEKSMSGLTIVRSSTIAAVTMFMSDAVGRRQSVASAKDVVSYPPDRHHLSGTGYLW